ncbi:MAG: hypothetical protein R6X25_14950 [Candidatus Krumholzibacteriia bacterium]
MAGKSTPAPGRSLTEPASVSPAGRFVVREGDLHYRISAYHRLDPFLVTVASDTDLWMFIASGGGLTAGRVDPDGSLFPYETVDRLHDAHHHTGPVTSIRIERGTEPPVLWRPLTGTVADRTAVERNLEKSVTGNSLVFEEIDHDLGLAFRYRWSGCDEFGWVRSATLENRTTATLRLSLLDGLRNVLPHGAPLELYQQSSNLVDAYKSSQVDPETGLGIFSLTAGITDRAEAIEILRANTVWCCGLDDFRVHLSHAAIDAFGNGRVLAPERVLNGARGNYLVSCDLDLEPGGSVQWHLVADVGRDHVQIVDLRRRILQDDALADRIDDSLRRAGENLRRYVASADGLQLSGRTESWTHHFANVLFNTMRGGVFDRNHDVPVADFIRFVRAWNRDVAERHRTRLAELPGTVTVQELRRFGRDAGDPDLERLCHEYLPLHFGRRHGDPSRPWNRFSIRARDRNGERELNYEGNWRDIFQNWEALGAAFPGFLPSIVAKFVDASTVDGFNPYRITRDGVDWEVPSRDDPWSNIGYWGDHQIVYLLRLLEALNSHDPTALGAMLDTEIFSYAEVPYRLKPHADIVRDPGTTIDFDEARAVRIEARVANVGCDGKLLTGSDGSVYHVNLLEKLLVPLLSKLSNLVPDAGIWMNTQRPEWNDANNALGGGGISVVTLCHLRRYVAFLADLSGRTSTTQASLSREVADWLGGVESALTAGRGLLVGTELDARDRKRLLDALGGVFSVYRETVYARGFSGRTSVPVSRIAALCRVALEYIDWGIAANRRADGLYHTYNRLEITADGSAADVVRLPCMLEGQVAVLSTGILEPAEALAVLERLFASDLYRPDQRSFMLYPDRELPGFLNRNQVPASRAAAIPLLRDLLAAGDGALLARDADGVLRFHGDLGHERDLDGVLDRLGEEAEWSEAVARDRAAVRDLFEDVFDHRSYTGRSGVMYGYEGLGCIYWHMVAKLLLAVQETVLRADREGRPTVVRDGLVRMYFRVRAGLGYEKTVVEFGAFPTDPYSHTPRGGGAKQPGMTGQVKEEILTRLGELGVRIEGGTVCFRPVLLRAGEFLDRPAEFRYHDVGGTDRRISVPANSLAFTLCQVPVIYSLVGTGKRLLVTFADGSVTEQPGDVLDARLSAELFSRSGRIRLIRLELARDAVLPW